MKKGESEASLGSEHHKFTRLQLAIASERRTKSQWRVERQVKSDQFYRAPEIIRLQLATAN